MGNIFGKNKEHHEKTPAEFIVDRYIKNKYINLPFLPNFIERNIYLSIVEKMLHELSNTINSINFNICNHKVKLNINKDSLAKLILDNKQATNIYNSYDKKNKYISSLVDVYADKKNFISNLESYLYMNIIKMINAIILDTFSTFSVKFLHQEFKFALCNDNVKTDFDFIQNDEKSNIIINEHVDNFLKENNLLFIPDSVERYFYTRCFSFVFFFIRNFLLDSQVSFMHNNITLNVSPD